MRNIIKSRHYVSFFTFRRTENMHGGGFIPKQSSCFTEMGCFLKATGFLKRSFLETRIEEADEAIEAVGMPGCQGEGIELPTSLPASETEK